MRNKVYLVECLISNKQWVVKAINKTRARAMIADVEGYGYDYFESEFYVNELFDLNNEERMIDITKEE